MINSDNLAIDDFTHVASICGYSSKHSRLIDDFYFSSFYMCRGALFIREITTLHFLADSGDYKAISAIVTHIERHHSGKLVRTVKVEDNHGQTLLHIAAKRGHLNVMKCLVNKGASTNTKDKYDNTPLHSAAYTGKLNIVKYLIIENNNINAKANYGMTPLHLTAENGKLNIAKCLIEKDADVNARDEYDAIPLHLAV
ncbi:MAG: ankyrin repeat domain-containing protein [Wolbachia sp.]